MLVKIFLERRKALNLSQRELSELSGLSLATIQNIEACKANPSLKVLTQLNEVLGLSLDIKETSFHWDDLSYFSGLLCSKKHFKKHELTRKNLSLFLRRGVFELKRNQVSERILEVFQALLLSIKNHYPKFYKNHENVYNQALPKRITPRHIKLCRIVLAHIGEYL